MYRLDFAKILALLISPKLRLPKFLNFLYAIANVLTSYNTVFLSKINETNHFVKSPRQAEMQNNLRDLTGDATLQIKTADYSGHYIYPNSSPTKVYLSSTRELNNKVKETLSIYNNAKEIDTADFSITTTYTNADVISMYVDKYNLFGKKFVIYNS